MIYLWYTPIKILECEFGDDLDKYIGRYNRIKGPDTALLQNGLLEGKIWGWTKNEFEFEFEASALELLKYDVLPNDASLIIVNMRVRHVLEDFAKDDIQFVPVTIKCRNGFLDGYFVVNILSRVSGIDKNKSKIEWGSVDEYNYIAGFCIGKGTLIYNHNCMGKHHIALEREFSFILFSQELKEALCSMNPPINEVRFVLPEETEWQSDTNQGWNYTHLSDCRP